jgi:hypothetical protein
MYLGPYLLVPRSNEIISICPSWWCLASGSNRGSLNSNDSF